MRNPRLLAPLLILMAASAGCGVPDENGPADTFFLDFSLPADAPKSGAIIFLSDGVNNDVFRRMLDEGQLPAFKKYFVDRGLYAPAAVASTPSVTMANLTSIVTGKFPGHHGIVGNNWFDRNQLIWRNYETISQKNMPDEDYRAATIYELLPDELTISDFYQPHRGATKWIEDRTLGAAAYAMGWYEWLDRLTLSRFGLIMDISRQCKRFPAVTMVYLLATDFRAYGEGVDSEAYRAALRHADRQIGRVLGDIERAGVLDKIHIAFVTDHCMCPVSRHMDMASFLREDIGLKLATEHWWENDPFEERMQDYLKYSAVVYGSGDKYVAICLRKPIRKADKVIGLEPWMVRPGRDDFRHYPANEPRHWPQWLLWVLWTQNPQTHEVDLLQELINQPGVDVVACHDGPQCVRVIRKGGEVEFRQPGGQGGEITCKLISGQDPLGYKGKVPADMLEGKPAGQRQWLEATIDTEFPDLPAQILAYFRAPRAGDLAVFAAPGCDFATADHYKAGHGGLRRCDMCVPILLAGPGVPHGTIRSARSVDLMPTILNLLGKPVPNDLDGKSLVPEATPVVPPATGPALPLRNNVDHPARPGG